MKGWVIKGVGTLAAIAALPFVIVGVLAAQDRLSSSEVEAFRHVPIVSSLLPPAREPRVEDKAGHGETEAVVTGPPVHKWPAGATITDPDALVEALNAQRTLYNSKLENLEKEHLRLERLGEDLSDQENALTKLQADLREERNALTHERKRLEATGTMISNHEAKTFKAMAKVIAEMDTTKAAETLSDLDLDRAAEILRVMDPSAVGAVLSDVRDAEKRKDLLDRITRKHLLPKNEGGK